MKNWKTSLAGLLMILPTILNTFFPEVVTSEVAMKLTALFGSLGLAVSKDHNVTGGTIEQ